MRHAWIGLLRVWLPCSIAALTAISASAASPCAPFNLRWNDSKSTVRSRIQAAGLKITGEVSGPQEELWINWAHGQFQSVDRGLRLKAVGDFHNLKSNFEFIFGNDNRLDEIIISREWRNPGCIENPHLPLEQCTDIRDVENWSALLALDDAVALMDWMIALANSLQQACGLPYERIEDEDTVQTARWRWPGRTLDLFLRSPDGFEFYFGHRVLGRAHFFLEP